MQHLCARLIGLTAILLTGTVSARAQNATNEAWIGQTGDTNTITIVQAGIGNSAGANSSTLQINQDGRFNAIVIDQSGFANQAGSEALSDSGSPQGINQAGDRNRIDLSQANTGTGGSNGVGAIYQKSSSGLFEIANDLLVAQSGTDGDGSAGHVIGFVSQTSTGDDLGTNLVRLFQTGGFAGTGNTVDSVLQRGYGNLTEIDQAQQDNVVGMVRQVGNFNQIVAVQGEGEANRVVEISQFGDLNRTKITQSGDRNHVASAYQNNEGIAISGNTIVATLAGDDNGGDGTGGVGAFTTEVANSVSVFQGAFSQIGDDNDIGFTVNGGSENLFGFSQDGDGNGAVVAIGRTTGPTAIYASRNEVAVVQIGDDNGLSLDVIGSGNAAGMTMRGERNQLALDQVGDSNVIDIAIGGNDNNYSIAASVGGFSGDLGILAAVQSLTPGAGLQSGNLNRSVIRVSGDANLFAFKQSGDENVATMTLTGTGNQALVSQGGDLNDAQVKQTGAGNSMAIVQF